MTQLRLIVFGPPRLEREGETLELGLRRALALLVYLAVTRRPQSRDALATLLWPESDQREARANLRRTLHRLTQAIGDDVLATSGETVSLLPGARLWVDSLAFSDLTGSPEALQEAVALYGDDFLAGFSLPDSPAFDEWQFFERERLRQLMAQRLEQLIQAARDRGSWDEAADYARRWVALDVLHEPAQRALLEAYAQAGQTVAALRQYQELARALEAELGAEPEEVTQALYEAIRTRRFPAASSAPDMPAPRVAGPPAGSAPGALPPAPPLVGRERELDELVRLLSPEGGARLVTLIGPGGVGKTHLAHAIVEEARTRFEHGAHLVALLEVREPDGIAPAIGARLGLVGGSDPEPRLLNSLREQELLLVLDNFEHLLDATPIISAILNAAPRVRVLITSRERLGLGDEQVYPLAGLGLPNAGLGAAALDAAAARLLLQRARLVRPELAPGPEDVAAIVSICRLVQGMPLALTLAASWAELLSFGEIAAEIARSLDFLATDQQDVPERQRSVRAVFEASWRRLEPQAQQIFAQLTVFRGGFTRQAAEQIAGADLHTLRRLVSSSFMTVNAKAQRYEIHELLRQLTADERANSPEIAAAMQRHSTYYLAMVHRLTPDLTSQRQRQALDKLGAEQDNVQRAWQVALARRERHAIAAAAEGLWLFGDLRGAYFGGEQLFAQATATLGESADETLAGVLIAAQGYFVARNHRLAEGRALMERGVALLRRALPSDGRRTAFALVFTGFVARLQEQYDDAERLAEESLALFADCDDRWGVVYSLLLMGWVVEYRGRPGLARQLLRACLDRSREVGESLAGAAAACSLARALSQSGDYPQARQLIEAAIAEADRLGDPLSLAAALHERGMLEIVEGRSEQAAASFEGSARAFSRLGDSYAAGPGAVDLALAGALRGDDAQLDRVVMMMLRAAQGQFERWHVARHLDLLGQLVAGRGDAPRAIQLHGEALRLAEQLGHEPAIATAAGHLAAAIAAQGAGLAELAELLRRSIVLAVRHQLAPLVLEAAVAVAPLLVSAGKAEQALELLGLAEHHPASPAAARTRAKWQREAFATGAPPPAVPLAASGASLDWHAAAHQLLHEFDESGPTFSPPPTNISARLPPLLGRDYELAQLVGLLSSPAWRLITVLGPGGIGKTRLAQEAGLVAIESFAQGAFFVPLAPMTDPAQIPAAIAEQVGLRFSGAAPLYEQLSGYLRDRQLLLVLDNFEHLVEAAEQLGELIAAAPRITLLVTSRERLSIAGEVVVRLGGVEVPQGIDDEHALERGAVQLLLQRVRQVRPGFDPGPTELDALIRICQLVQGMPLALILAASWVELLSLAQIADEIAGSLELLAADLRDLPPRQRSMSAVFQSSWQRLPDGARRAFARMTVFRGGFSRRAAQQVAGADLRTLRALVNSSFVALDADDRYSVHELLRQYGAEQLVAFGEADLLRDHHSAYYLQRLAALEPDLKGGRQADALREIEGDLDNLRQAWERALEQRNTLAIGRALNSMFLFTEKRGRFREGSDLLQQAHDQLAPRCEDSGELWLRLTSRLSILRSLFPRAHQVPPPEVERALELARQAGMAVEEALAHVALGTYYARTENDYARAFTHYERAYSLHQALDDRFYMAEDLARLGVCHGYLGDTQAFYECCREGYDIARQTGNRIGMMIAQANMTEALIHLGRYAEAADSAARQVVICQELQIRNGVINALQSSALMRLLEGDLAEARRLALEGYRLGAELQNMLSMGGCLAILSLQAGLSGNYPLGQQLAEDGLAQPLNLLATVNISWGLAIAQCGLGRYADARSSLRVAFGAAEKMATLAPRVWLMPLLALLLAQDQRPEDAVTLLSLGENHPLGATGWMRCWRMLADLRASLEEALGAETYAAAWEQGRSLSLQSAIASLDGAPLH